MQTVETSTGAQIAYQVVGSGVPVIAIHGWLPSPTENLDTVAAWLSEHYQVYTPYRRGYGESLPKPRTYDAVPNFYHRDALDMLAFIDALNIPRAHLLGFSDGGETALVMGGLAPERFTSVVAWGAVGTFGDDIRPAVQRSYPPDWLDDATIAYNHIEDRNAIVLGWIAGMNRIIDLGGDVSLSLAPAMRAPTLVLLGENDSLNPEHHAQRLIDAMPSGVGELKMFPGIGHSIHKEATGKFQAVVGGFLAKHS